MESLIQHAGQAKPGLNYLVPQSWWEDLQTRNIDVANQKNFLFPPLNTDHMVDSFLLDFKDEIQDQIELKLNYLKFQNVVISPQPLSSAKWKAIPPQLWKLHMRYKSESVHSLHPILTYIQSCQEEILSCPTVQLSIVFCSRMTSHLLIGFFPENCSLVGMIRDIGFEMGFIEMANSRINFPDKYAEKNYSFQDFQRFTVKNTLDTIIMVFNLERHVEEQDQKRTADYRCPNNPNNSFNEAVPRDMLTMIDDSRERVNDGTLSTGAETPFSFFQDEGYNIDREYRVNELFRDKTPEEVQAMKVLARDHVHGELIQVPHKEIESMQQQLDKMADEILEGLHLHKKKPKEKENSYLHE